MEAVKISDNVYWVGAIDWNGRNFHGYDTPRGTSYNAYLIIDDKIALIDAVKTPFLSQMMERIRSVVDPKDIDIIISNHSENDHSSGLPMVQEWTGAPIYASRKGVEHLPLNYGPLQLTKVMDGQELNLGKYTLRFMDTPMLHWPDSMFTYLKEQGILFCMDGFGQHFASSKRFDDEVDKGALFEEAAKYYANILMPFGQPYFAALEKLKGLDIKMLATAHGVIWRSEIPRILQLYDRWANHQTEERALLVFDSMWGSTEKMALAIAEGISAGGVPVRVCKASATPRSLVMREVLDARAVIFGTPTLNMGMFPTMADVGVYLKGLRPRNRIGACFGAYGWSAGGVKALRESLNGSGLDFPFEDIEVRFNPQEADLRRCYEFGLSIAKKIIMG
jgi:anaerobic nitric oxide reductase flavorubredoxin